MVSKCFSLLLLVAVAATWLASPSEAMASLLRMKDCTKTLYGLVTCTDFIFDGAASPTPECCASFNSTLDTQPLCLCYVINGEMSKLLNNEINVTLALEIPGLCGRKTPSLDICKSSPLPPLRAPPPGAAQGPSGPAPVQAQGPAQASGSAQAAPALSDGRHSSSIALPLLFVSSIAYGVVSLF